MASPGAIKAGEAFVSLNADDRAFTASLTRFQSRLRGLGTEIRRLSGAGLGVGLVMAPVANTFLHFDDAIRMTEAVTGATADEFERLRENALLLGRTTSFTAAEVANLMGELGKAGFKPDEINDMTAAVLNLARATGTDAVAASGFMAATLRQFSLGAKEATRVADALTVAANLSFNSVTDLGEALKYAGPVAADLGMSLEDTLALLGALGNVGIQGEMAGTTLRRLSTLLAAGGKEFREVFGVETVDAFGNVRQLADVMQDLFTATADLPTALRTEKFQKFFGLLGITGASAISKNVANVRELREALGNAAGTAEKTAKKMDAGIGGAFRRAASAAEGTAIALGESLAPALELVGRLLEEATGAATRWIGENRKLATQIGAAVVGFLALGAAGAGLLGLGFVFKAAVAPVLVLVAAVKLLVAGVAALLSPIGLVVAAVAGLTYAFFRFTETGRRLGAEIAAVFREIGAIVEKTFGGIAAAMGQGNLLLAWKITAKGLGTVWLRLIETMQSAWVKFTLLIPRAFGEALLGVVERANAAAELLARARGELPEEKVVRQKAQAELTPIEAEQDAERRRQANEQAKIDRLRAGIRARGKPEDQKTLGESVKVANLQNLDEETIRALEKNIEVSKGRLAKLNKDWSDVWQKHSLGQKWIDPKPFMAVEGDLDKLAAERMKGWREARERAERELAELTDLANGPDFAGLLGAGVSIADLIQFGQRQTPTAPMPHRPGAAASPAQQFGDAVRGLYQSGDFRGALSIGPANDMAGRQLDATKGVETAIRDVLAPKLDKIERAVRDEAPRFT
jgi:TP901 family phage tail tape measure protein